MNVLSPDKIAALLARDNPVGAVGSLTGQSGRGEDAAITSDRYQTPSTLIWCDFCKGNYNEYHFGEPEGGDI